MNNTARTSLQLGLLCLLPFGALSCGSASSHATGGHSLHLDVVLSPDTSGQVAFLSPSNTIVKYPASSIAGKPYLVGTFRAGFVSGSDPPVDHEWGVMPADLTFHYSTPSTYQNGPYDVVFVIYTNTPITQAIESGPAQAAPAAKGGDLASFSLDQSTILPGDPKNPLGTIRFNVKDSDTAVGLANRTPADPSNSAQTSAAFNNTILTVP